MSTEEVVILSAVRTPIGSFCGSLSSLKAHELGAITISEALKRANLEAEEVSEVIFGQVLTAGQGQNPVRQAALAANIPQKVPATLINLLCGSSLKSIIVGSQSIKSGDAQVVVAGGQESMSQAQHCIYLRGCSNNTGSSGGVVRLGEVNLKDSLLQDGLHDAFHFCHMGITAENVAKQWNIGREEQDAYAFKSQQDTIRTYKENLFAKEIVPVEIKQKDSTVITIDKDEFPRPATTLESLANLQPAFLKDGTGTVTVGNATGMNDGAAAVVISSRKYAESKGIKPLARIVSHALEGMEPLLMGMGPVLAVQSALKKANWSVDDVDLYELNEPYAASSIGVMRDLKVDPSKCNVNGGAIALGHPLGSSGTRVLVTLIHALIQRNKSRGVASLCIGGGMGIAMCVEII